jgi:ATP-binding cassette subfamily B protein
MAVHGDETGPVSAAYDARLVRRLWQYIHPHRRLIFGGVGLLLLASACRLALPLIQREAVDAHLVRDDFGRDPSDFRAFAALLAVFVVVASVEYVARRLQTYLVDRAGQDSLFDLRMALFTHLQRLSSRFYDRTPIGRLVGRATTDIEALQEMFSSGVVTILGDLVFLVATIVILLVLDWQLALITFCVIPILLVVTTLIRVRVRGGYQRLRTRLSQLNAFLHERISGMHLVQMFAREDVAIEGMREINDDLRDAQLFTVRWETFLSALTEMLGSFTFAVILYWGVGLAVDDAGQMDGFTLGTLWAFIEYMSRFFGPLNELSQKYTTMQNAMTASDRIFALLDEDDVTPEPAEPRALPAGGGGLEFRGVNFAYVPGEPVLKDVSFSVAAGERVAIVGATGSGKTTILKLLTRLYDIDEGSILIDGMDVREAALKDLRSRVGIVPQDVFLFGGNILENVRLGHPEISDEQAIAAAEELHLGEVVARFPGGYREPVRERGKNLSAGEAQLIAFARVLATSPPVLALDEATSNVDSHTEHLLQDAVHRLMEGRTALIIAHRLSTIRDVDRILVLHKGELVEQGTHEELLALGGVYWRLYELQFGSRARGDHRAG